MNKRGDLNFAQMFFVAVLVTISLSIMFAAYVNGNIITISRPYKVELDKCLTDLTALQQVKEVKCPAVTCNFGAAGFGWIAWAVIMYVGALALFWWNNRNWDKRNNLLEENMRVVVTERKRLESLEQELQGRAEILDAEEERLKKARQKKK